MATLADIRELSEKAKKKEKEFMKAEAEKKEIIKSLSSIKSDIEDMELPDSRKKAFKAYIDAIIENDGDRPSENPIKEYVDEINDNIDEVYERARKILEGAK